MIDVQAQAEALAAVLRDGIGHLDREATYGRVCECSDALLEMGDAASALRLLRACNASSIADPSEGRIAVLHVRALVASGSAAEAIRAAELMLQEPSIAARLSLALRLELRVWRASALWQLGRADDAVEQLGSIRVQLLAHPDSVVTSLCAQQLCAAELTRGRNVAAWAHGIEALVSARRVGSRFVEAMALASLGQIEKARARWQAAREYTENASAMYHALGNVQRQSHALRTQAIIELKCGHLHDADSLCLRSAELATGTAGRLNAEYAVLVGAIIAIHRGEFGQADAMLRSLAGSDSRTSVVRPSLLTTEFLGDVHLEQGQATEALAFYDEVLPQALALVPKGDIVAELRRRRAECFLLLGRHDEALAEAHVGLDHCRELGDRYEEAATYRILALTAAALGRPVEAREWFEQGFAMYDDIETPYEWGKLWLAYGDWLRGAQAGDFADESAALEAYHAAREHFDRMGARARLADANARIADVMAARAGVAPPSPARPDPAEPAARPARWRPARGHDLERRSEWAREAFGIVTRQRAILDMLDGLARAAESDTTVLVLGESGTGKELVANGVHRLSRRAGQLIAINCAALPRDMVESELFGHVAGSFTGALRDKAGLFEVCDGGTVFLDEVGEMAAETQTKLLRYLEHGETRRIGGTRMIKVDTRIVAATNRDHDDLEMGRGFRPDLYYRLAQLVVTLPPLRHRGDDVELLVDHFLDRACARERKRVRLSAAARRRLLEYRWPGNVRQLQTVLRRAVVLAHAGSEVPPESLGLTESTIAVTLGEELEAQEIRRIREALAATSGSRADAARRLGIPRTTLLNRMKRFGIEA